MPSEAVQLSLRTWPEEDVAARSLRSLIPRISKQRGHLRNINEEDLAQEVQALEAASGDQPGHADDGQPGDGDDGGPDRTKDVMAAREEIVKQIGWVSCSLYEWSGGLIVYQAGARGGLESSRLCLSVAVQRDTPPGRDLHVAVP